MGGMFATDGTTIFYPTNPNRVFNIGIRTLALAPGSDNGFEMITFVCDLATMVTTEDEAHRLLDAIDPADPKAPRRWPDGDAEDFADALEMWADWCDRQSEAMDAADAVREAA
jgi:chemotaxis regulatin CheY-phosphate phosphatase CheZ